MRTLILLSILCDMINQYGVAKIELVGRETFNKTIRITGSLDQAWIESVFVCLFHSERRLKRTTLDTT